MNVSHIMSQNLTAKKEFEKVELFNRWEMFVHLNRSWLFLFDKQIIRGQGAPAGQGLTHGQ